MATVTITTTDRTAKSDTGTKNVQFQQSIGVHQDQNEIFTVKKLCKRHERHREDNELALLYWSILSINFSPEDLRPQSWNPGDPLLITSYICQKQIHHVYIDNSSSTDILYVHCFQQMPTS